MKVSRLFSAMAVGALVLAAAPAFAQQTKSPTPAPASQPKDEHQQPKTEPKKDEKPAKAEARRELVAPGTQAPEIKLKDLDGKEWTLSSALKEGKTVVVYWFNPECPFVKKHFNGTTKTFNELTSKYADKNVLVVAINSGAPGQQGAGLERNKKAHKEWSMNHPILLDETGEIGHAYGAANTPATLIIGKDGKVIYAGAIDDDSGADKAGKTNYAAKALDETLAGTNVTTSKTKAYGCSVKYKG